MGKRRLLIVMRKKPVPYCKTLMTLDYYMTMSRTQKMAAVWKKDALTLVAVK